ncbi:uncharacterized protein LOC123300863 [Chrysoperla carnea]|uniref:uncharacterized protein LOC123300863 n=1 Tax=Chrysoperla carnea TaxID=189513 RepID=UPI001D08E81C|nr:uncharacterized protein LOC123300863 [Chrysoperla carnea]
MNKSISAQFLVLTFLFNVAFAYIYTIQNATSEERPGKCFHEASQIELAPGETIKLPGNCEKITCNSDFSIDGTGCGFTAPARYPCRDIPQDINKPFPECCATVICDNNRY